MRDINKNWKEMKKRVKRREIQTDRQTKRMKVIKK